MIPYDVRNSGAVGDGSTDDTAAVQAAITAGDVWFPAGFTFKVTSLNVVSNRIIKIDGTVKSADGNADIFKNDAPVTNVSFCGSGTIDGNKAVGSGTSRGIFVSRSGTSNIEVVGLHVKNCHGDGISVYDCLNVRVIGNLLEGCRANGIKLEANAANMKNVVVTNNLIFGTDTQNGIFLYGNAPHTIAGFSVAGNIVENAADIGIEIGFNCTDGNCNGNSLIDATNVGILARGCSRTTIGQNSTYNCDIGIDVATYDGADPDMHGITVSANSCFDGGDSVNNFAGIRVNQSINSIIKHILITGNTCKGNRFGILVSNGGSNISTIANHCYENYMDGICYTDVLHGIISTNQCWNNYQENGTRTSIAGIRASYNSVANGKLSITKNRCWDDQGMPTQINGIYYSNLLGSEITDNYLVGNKTAAIASSGTNTNTWLTRNQTASGKQVIQHSWSQGSIAMADGQGFTLAQTVAGAAFGDRVFWGCADNVQGVTVTAAVSAADTIQVRVQNETGGAITINAAIWYVDVEKRTYR